MQAESASKYLPQQPPFLLVDDILFCEGKVCRTDYTVSAAHPLFFGDYLSEAGLMEHIAQSCAARIGYLEVHSKHSEVRVGVIGSVRNLTIHRLPAEGEYLETQVEEVFEGFMDMSVLQAEVRIGNEVVAACEMKVALV